VDAKLCSRQQQLRCVEQELSEMSLQLESERKQQPHVAEPDLQDAAAERVVAVCFQCCWFMTLSTILHASLAVLSVCWSVLSMHPLCFDGLCATTRASDLRKFCHDSSQKFSS